MSTLQSHLARWGWALALIALMLLVGVTYYLDRQNQRDLMLAQRDASAAAEREASELAEAISSEMAARVGALAAAKLQFTQVQDSLSQQTILAAVDSVIVGLPGLTAVTVIASDGSMSSSSGALLTRTWREPLTMPGVEEAYQRALSTGRPTSTAMLDLVSGQRFVVFDPVASPDGGPPQAVLAAEIQPLTVIRAALESDGERIRPAFYDLYDPDGHRVTTVPSPPGWVHVTRPVRIADRDWQMAVSHQPVNVRSFEMLSGAIRVTGLLLALAFSASLLFLWRTVAAQQREIALRVEAERQAQQSASAARALSEQLAAAQEAALRLSRSLDPAHVADEFLGMVGEMLGSDLALLYGFDDDGDQLIGRQRVVLSPGELPGDMDAKEDFRQVRVPIGLMPHLAQALASGEPQLLSGEEGDAPAPGVGRPSASLAVPLTIAGHLVGLAVWESYAPGASLDAASIPFARGVSAQAAATLRAAELLEAGRSARKKAAREAGRLAAVLNQLADGVVLFDRTGHPRRVNPAAVELLGEKLHETRLQDWPDAFWIQDGGRRMERAEFALARSVEGQRFDRSRLTIRRQGVDRYYAVSAAPIRGDDAAIRGVALVIRDVTDEHEYAELLRHTNQELREQAMLLERANDELTAATLAKDQFLAMMSHELRTPINAIIGYSDLLDMGIHGSLNAEQRRMVTRVVETSRHLLGLINDVLDLTKISAGRIDLDIQDVALNPILNRALNQVAPLADENGIDLDMTAEEDILLRADETRVAQILINLAANAVKFTEEGRVSLSARIAHERAIITVEDTGPGIPEEELDRIFEEFHQVDSSHARKVGGTGLGLAISRRLARLMGGDLRVKSVMGEGTEFTIELPLGTGRGGHRSSRERREDEASRRAG